MTQTVWLHGTALSKAPFGPNEGARPNLPGHSGRALTAATVDAMAAAIADDLPPRFALVGHSLGGMIAMHLAGSLPKRCHALVLVDTPLWIPRWVFPATAARLAPWGTHAVSRLISAAIVGARTGNPAARPAVRRSIRAMTGPGLARAVQAACRFDGRGLAAQLAVPTLALFGARSPLTTRAMVATLDANPMVRTQVMPTGHMLPYEAPHEFAATVSRFLETTP